MVVGQEREKPNWGIFVLRAFNCHPAFWVSDF